MVDLITGVGRRVQIDKHRATVRYSGEIAGQEGLWIGLEWDDASRGKHDGSVNGHRYFTCVQPGNTGSFVRGSKFQQVADLGHDLPQALTQRYQEDGASSTGAQEMSIASSRKRVLPVELVGEEQVRQSQARLEDATQATLAGARISSVGRPGALHALAPNLAQLDLAANLLPSWEEASKLAHGLPALRALDLSASRMAFPAAATDACFGALRTLVLNQCRVAWEEVMSIEAALPVLERLHLSGNGIQSLGAPGTPIQGFTSLQALVLDDNTFSDWVALRPLSALPCLRRLSLAGNDLAAIQPPGDGFEQLQSLNLGDNRIDGWGSVDALSLFRHLSELRLSGNPVLPEAAADSRFEVIARMGRLCVLNASAVTAHERKDCELRYLRGVLGSGLEPEELHRQHPRLAELQERYGDTGASEAAAQGAASLASRLIELRLTCTAAAPAKTGSTVTKKLPRGMQLGKLKALCEHLFRLPAARQALQVPAAAKGAPPRRLGGGDDWDLASFELQDGSELLLAELDVAAMQQAAAQEQAARAAEHEGRLRQQMKGVELLKAVRDEQFGGAALLVHAGN